MKQKKLMLLGGIRYLLPVIKAAHEQGYYVITADYIPDNIAHKYSDEYVNVSIIDKEAYEEIADYIASIKQELPPVDFARKKVGAIVMNCNPFTNGHKYLIETARNKVDVLLIFVLEEDKSYFSYKDRMTMVKLGTADMGNVYVVPSGKFMISALTFPEYFVIIKLEDFMETKERWI